MALRSSKLRKPCWSDRGTRSPPTPTPSARSPSSSGRPGRRPTTPHPGAARPVEQHHDRWTSCPPKPHVLSTVLSAILYESLISIFELLEGAGAAPAGRRRPPSTRHAAGHSARHRRGDLPPAAAARDRLPASRRPHVRGCRPRHAGGRSRGLRRHRRHGDRRRSPAVRAALRRPRRRRRRRRVDSRRHRRSSPSTRTASPTSGTATGPPTALSTDHRIDFEIPEGTPFTVLARVDATKEIGRKVDGKYVRCNGS